MKSSNGHSKIPCCDPLGNHEAAQFKREKLGHNYTVFGTKKVTEDLIKSLSGYIRLPSSFAPGAVLCLNCYIGLQKTAKKRKQIASSSRSFIAEASSTTPPSPDLPTQSETPCTNEALEDNSIKKSSTNPHLEEPDCKPFMLSGNNFSDNTTIIRNPKTKPTTLDLKTTIIDDKVNSKIVSSIQSDPEFKNNPSTAQTLGSALREAVRRRHVQTSPLTTVAQTSPFFSAEPLSSALNSSPRSCVKACPDCCCFVLEFVEILKTACSAATTDEQKVEILLLLPSNWTTEKIVSEFKVDKIIAMKARIFG